MLLLQTPTNPYPIKNDQTSVQLDKNPTKKQKCWQNFKYWRRGTEKILSIIVLWLMCNNNANFRTRHNSDYTKEWKKCVPLMLMVDGID